MGFPLKKYGSPALEVQTFYGVTQSKKYGVLGGGIDEPLQQNSEQFSTYHICPPNYPELTYNEIDYVCSVLNDI